MDEWFPIALYRQRLTHLGFVLLVGSLGSMTQASGPIHVAQVPITEAAAEKAQDTVLESGPISLNKSDTLGAGLELPEKDPTLVNDPPSASRDDSPVPAQQEGSQDPESPSEETEPEIEVRAEVIRGSEKPWTEFGHQAFSGRVLDGFQLSELQFENPPSPVVTRIPSVTSFTWINPAARNQPTYFDDVDLERYGHVRSFQTVRSAVRFGKDVLTLPIEHCKNRETDCVYQSGLARPGDAACPVKKRL